MSCDITAGRGDQCKAYHGGLEAIYIFPYTKHAKSLIVRNGLILTSYPNTFVYPFAIVSGEYSEASSIDDGGDLMDQSLTVTMTYLNEDNEWKKLLQKDHCVICKDRNGKFRLMGVYNGVETDYQATTGNGHADFNGFTFNFKAKEEDEALYFDDLLTVGFTNVAVDINFIFQDEGNFIFQDSNNFIYN